MVSHCIIKSSDQYKCGCVIATVLIPKLICSVCGWRGGGELYRISRRIWTGGQVRPADPDTREYFGQAGKQTSGQADTQTDRLQAGWSRAGCRYSKQPAGRAGNRQAGYRQAGYRSGCRQPG